MDVIVYTVGHSTLEGEAFLEILNAHGIECVADVRSYPGSRKFPQFNQETLKVALESSGIEYIWLKALGGRRGKAKFESPNTGLRSPAFRNYADYMLTEEFEQGIAELLEIASEKKTAVMCAEKLFFRCHRRLISDWLTARGLRVVHLYDEKRTQEHGLAKEAQVREDGRVIYPADSSAS